MDIKYIHSGTQLNFTINNKGLLTHKKLVKSIFKILKTNEEFKIVLK